VPAQWISFRLTPIRRQRFPSTSPNSPRKKRSRIGLGSRGHFPGPLFLAVAPVEIEWPQREVWQRFGANQP